MILALDPGCNGGCVYTTSCGIISVAPKTDGEWLTEISAAYLSGARTAYLEDIVLFAGTNMPSSSGIKYGASWGFLKGVIMALGFRVVLVPPKAWQKALGLGSSKSHGSRTAWKNHLKQRAEQLFPKIKVTLATADALLIYEAARRGLIG